MSDTAASTVPASTLRLRVDEGALAGNWTALDRMSGRAQTGAAVKADAYGLGARRAVEVLSKTGCMRFYVAHWGEVAPIANVIDPAQISVLHGPITAQDCQYARQIGARPVINSLFQAQLWHDSGGGACDLMVDTGINRLGIAIAEVGEPLLQSLQIETLMSHLACADEDSPKNAQQLALFQQASTALSASALSLCNSAGIALGNDFHFDLTRPGIALYGGVPREELRDNIAQVAHLQAALLQRRRIMAGEAIGYNARYIAGNAMEIGVVSLGYADGFLRQWSPLEEGVLEEGVPEKGVPEKRVLEEGVLEEGVPEEGVAQKGQFGETATLKGAARELPALQFQGANLPILGKISMDMVVVDLTQANILREGDWLDIPYDLPNASRASGLSQYELLTVLGQRFTR